MLKLYYMVNQINRNNLYLRGILTLVVGIAVVISLFGGIEFLLAVASDDSADLPEGYSATDPVSDPIIQSNGVALATDTQKYTYRYSQRSATSTHPIDGSATTVSADLTEQVGVRIRSSDSQSGEERDEIYETEDTIYQNTNGEITTQSKSEVDVQSPVLENHIQNAAVVLKPFSQFKWALDDVSNNQATYTLSRADSANIPNIQTIRTAEGELVLDTENGIITEISIIATGTNPSQPATTPVTTQYQYNAETDAEITPPEWIENEDD